MGIYANALFLDKESENYMLGAVNGFNEMMEYVENLMRKAVGYKLYITKEDTVADQICTYIDRCIRLGFSQNRVLPEPEPPITITFLFLAVLGSLG